MEAISGKALNKQGVLEPTLLNRAEEINRIRRQLTHEPDHDDWVIWGRWFLADPATRTISPFSTRTVPEYIEDRIQERTADSLDEAERLAGDNEPLLKRIAEARTRSAGEALAKNTLVSLAEAARLAVGNEELLKRITEARWPLAEEMEAWDRAEDSAGSGHWKEAAADYARLIELHPTNHLYYHSLAPLLVQAADLEGYRLFAHIRPFI